MLLIVSVILYVLAAICFGIAAFVRGRVDTETVRWGGWIPLGLLFWVLVPLIQTVASIP